MIDSLINGISTQVFFIEKNTIEIFILNETIIRSFNFYMAVEPDEINR